MTSPGNGIFGLSSMAVYCLNPWMKHIVLLGAAVASLLTTVNPCLAQGTTAFTYQGQLRDGGTNANGVYAMTFKLFDAASDGSQIGGTLTSSPSLANGLFTVNLDFGAGAFNATARWLEIRVAGDTLVPRVQVLSSPYAQFATVAAAVPDGAIVNASLAANAVAAANIQNGAVTTAKIANGAVTDAKIVSVSGGKIFGSIGISGGVNADGGFNTTNNVWGLDLIASRNLHADGTIGTSKNIHADGSIFAGDGISTSGHISTTTNIHADGTIFSGSGINTSNNVWAGQDIIAGRNIHADGTIGTSNNVHADGTVFAGAGISTSGSMSADGGFSTTNNVWGQDIIASRNVYADGSVFAGNGIDTRSIVNADGGFHTTNTVWVGNTLHANGQISTSSGIYAGGDLHADGTLHADGQISTSSGIHAGSDLHADGTIYADGLISSAGNISASGNMYASAFVPSSDRNVKKNFASVDSQEILERVASLPISRWSFKTDAATRHIGPMAQDFAGAFNVGEDDKHIATVDADGVALAAIQGLHSLIKTKDAEIADLKKRLETLEKAVLKQNGGGQ